MPRDGTTVKVETFEKIPHFGFWFSLSVIAAIAIGFALGGVAG